MAKHQTEVLKAANGDEALVRYRRTSIDGQRGVVWEWKRVGDPDVSASGETNWSDANGPEATIAEARQWARECIGSWSSI